MWWLSRSRQDQSARTWVAGAVKAVLWATVCLVPQGAWAADSSAFKKVEEHLAAGEYTTATEIANGVQDTAEQAALLAQIAQTQIERGDVVSAQVTTRRITDASARQTMRRQARARSQAGGGNFANPGPLMQMIMDLTGGAATGAPWRDVDGEGGTMSYDQNGVRVDPNGILLRSAVVDQNGRLAALGQAARDASINSDMAQPSKLRWVSLARLEKAVAERLQEGQPVLETMRHMAGLHHIQYVVIVPEEKDILIGGPAEGWRYTATGSVVGKESGHPTLYLDDLVTVLRTFSAQGTGLFGCSINPRKEGLRAVKEYVEASQAKGAVPPEGMKRFLGDIQKRMGLQDLEIFGVPANSRVAKVLVTADYRMKLIGIDRLEAIPEIPSVFDLLPKFSGKEPPALDALRWWLTMKYDAIAHSPDRNVYEIQGSSVLVLSEDQIVQADGERIQTGQASPVNTAFAKNFTEHYQELAKKDLVFAELQNIFDLGMVAALVQSERLSQRAGWEPGVFDVEGRYRPAVMATAKTVDSVINHRIYRGKDIVVQVAGGVRADVLNTARDKNLRKESGELDQVAQLARPSQLPEGRWWWDAK